MLRFLFFTICLLFLAPVSAVSPPKPIQGYPSIISGKSTTLGSGDFLFTFSCPPEWGIGDLNLDNSGSGDFLLFPSNGGYGCSVNVMYIQDPLSLENQYQMVRSSLQKARSTKPEGNGIQALYPTAWFYCEKQGQHLIQMWLSFTELNLVT